MRHRTDGYLKSGAHLAGLPLGTGTGWRLKGGRDCPQDTGCPLLTLGPDPSTSPSSVPPYRALQPCSAPGSRLRSALGWFTLPWRHPGVKATWLCSIHRDVAPLPPAPALLSVLGWEWGDFGQIPTFFTSSHLKQFAPQMGAGAERYCAPLFTGSANGEDLSVPLPSQWMDLQDNFSSIEFLSLSKESEAQGQTKAFWSWPVCTGLVSCTTFFFRTASPQGIVSFGIHLNCLNHLLEKQSPVRGAPGCWAEHVRQCGPLLTGLRMLRVWWSVLELVSRHASAGMPRAATTRKGKNSQTRVGSYPCGLLPKTA